MEKILVFFLCVCAVVVCVCGLGASVQPQNPESNTTKQEIPLEFLTKMKELEKFHGEFKSFKSSLLELTFAFVRFHQSLIANGNGSTGENKEAAKTTTTTESTTTLKPTTTRPREPPIEVSRCPDSSSIRPCRCDKYLGKFKIRCSGSAINETSVENSLRELRPVNGTPEDRKFPIFKFELPNRKLTLLDLTPFYGRRVDRLQLKDNLNLTGLVTSGDPQDHGSIHNASLSILSIPVSTCPDSSAIWPCHCDKYLGKFLIGCWGSAINETSIENSLRELRRANGIPEDRGFSIFRFELENTNLSQLDLAPFCGSRVDRFQLKENLNLTKLVTSGDPQDHGSIHIARLSIWSTPITGEGFGDTLKYFSNEMTYFLAVGLDLNLDLNNNNNNNTEQDESEFLPGISALTNLITLTFNNCKISGSLTSSHFNFKEFAGLKWISLSGNKIDRIGSDVFPSGISFIFLGQNKLTENSIHPNSGIVGNQNQTGRKTGLELSFNQISTLPAPIFQTFLSAHPQNKLWLSGNPLICDEKLSWIKSRWAEFQSKVEGADCSNDKGRTVFNSNLIP